MINKLEQARSLTDAEFAALLQTDQYDTQLFAAADRVRRRVFGRDVYIRGLIELSNHCKNNCYYCGIRRDNTAVARYRLTKEDILACCGAGYAEGFRSFVLQGGEDSYFTDPRLCDIITAIKAAYPDCAITLSLGERSRESYQALFAAGADRYLLRHETADDWHYSQLHPDNMRAQSRRDCLQALKEIGYQVGSGFMVGSPRQTTGHLIQDLRFLQALQPHMIGIGPYLTHKDTPFRAEQNGSLALTLRLIAVLRLMFPQALIPSTTALGTISPDGRERGLRAGANVMMPNLSPAAYREKYALYDNKITTGKETAEAQVQRAGYRIVVGRGDAPGHEPRE